MNVQVYVNSYPNSALAQQIAQLLEPYALVNVMNLGGQLFIQLEGDIAPTPVTAGSKYHIANIRTLMTEGFSDEELRRIAYDNPEFRPVYHQLAGLTGKASIIDRLIDYTERQELMDELLVILKQLNPSATVNMAPTPRLPLNHSLQPQLSVQRPPSCESSLCSLPTVFKGTKRLKSSGISFLHTSRPYMPN